MLNVIIPLAGTGSRFLRNGYARPKPFIKVKGKELILWLMENLTLQSNDAVVFIFNRNPEFGMSTSGFFTIVDDYMSALPDSSRPQVNYVYLDKPTIGAAETVLRGIEYLPSERLKAPSVLLDGDTFYTTDVLRIFRGMSRRIDTNKDEHAHGGGVVVFDDDRRNESPYSYVKLMCQSNTISQIQEKSKEGMSGLACSGCYFFYHTMTLMVEIQHALHLYEENFTVSECHGELYTSSIIANMLLKGGEFKAVKLELTDFKVLGTPAQLQSFITCTANTGQQKKRFCFDLDTTLVTSPTVSGDYTTCKPIQRVIDYVQKLHAAGHYIIIHTARRMRTHGGNVGSVIADVGAVTIQQLHDRAIPYDELIFGKPFADFYVDDKAILPFIDELHKETGIIV